MNPPAPKILASRKAGDQLPEEVPRKCHLAVDLSFLHGMSHEAINMGSRSPCAKHNSVNAPKAFASSAHGRPSLLPGFPLIFYEVFYSASCVQHFASGKFFSVVRPALYFMAPTLEESPRRAASEDFAT